MMTADRLAEMISAVRRHAHDRYEFDGWDYVVEAMGDDDIARHIGAALSVEQAIENVGKIVKAWDDRRTDIRNG